jgi:hypothetical protein
MLGPVDYALWGTGFCLEVGVVVCCLVRKEILRHITISLYMLAAAAATVGHFLFFQRFGLSSLEYFYFYYYSDALLTILLYFCIIQLYQQIFEEMGVKTHIRGAALLLLVGTAWVSFMMVRQHENHMTDRFVVELSQNLYFVGLVLTYVLWGAVMKLRETRTRLIQLVLALGVYFSAYSATYALRNLFPHLEFTRTIMPPLVGAWLPIAWSYTLWKVPAEARLATARLAATFSR